MDLKDEIQKYLEAGDHIVLLIDGNSSMKGSDLSNVLRKFPSRKALYPNTETLALLLISVIQPTRPLMAFGSSRALILKGVDTLLMMK